MKRIAILAVLPYFFIAAAVAAPADPPLRDKTLVVWAAPANLTQRGGSVLTIDDGQGRFDGIIFGEHTPRKWMPGSEGHLRTLKEQANWLYGAYAVAKEETWNYAFVVNGRPVSNAFQIEADRLNAEIIRAFRQAVQKADQTVPCGASYRAPAASAQRANHSLRRTFGPLDR